MAIILASPAFRHGETIPKIHTCDGINVSPPLEWSGLPSGTRSLVVVCLDPDAPGGTFHHWAAYNISPEETGLKAKYKSGMRDPRFMQAINDFGTYGYGGPCPPRGSKPHAYHFRLSALNGRLDEISATSTCDEIIRRAKGLEIGAADLVGYYGR
ncbi:YbhB/YbcL family Raf kinase inhibitor-like protein [Hyphomicrobium sp. 99]|uniref:YbhB/YbcL family Raf kinase inhibitor-like protein n=1 Tax=Hyphomicrobium sp. 99 TaxID=1163419 RepID=UPI0005F86476|nr:YbhB/YbcL family Raf kinase inhibitor-like protein [Hyphomicrobium sp. 99]